MSAIAPCLEFLGGSSIKTHYYPALLRQYGEINGPYLLQTDGCGSIAKGVQDFNALMGREAIRILFRGRGENDPYVTQRRGEPGGQATPSQRNVMDPKLYCTSLQGLH